MQKKTYIEESKREGMVAIYYQQVSISTLYACIKVSLIESFVIIQKEALLDLWSIQGVIQRHQRNWGFDVEKKGGEETWMVKVAKSCHQVTWKQKREKKKARKIS